MPFALGSSSKAKLVYVRHPLVRVVQRAIEVSEIDFGVTEGVRTLARQKVLLASGASNTLNSLHLPDKDGLARAVDLAPYLDTDGDGDKEYSWHWGHVYPMAEAMRKAAIELQIGIIWGGVWDKPLHLLKNDLEDEMASYVLRWKLQNPHTKRKGPLADGPHFQLALT